MCFCYLISKAYVDYTIVKFHLYWKKQAEKTSDQPTITVGECEN